MESFSWQDQFGHMPPPESFSFDFPPFDEEEDDKKMTKGRQDTDDDDATMDSMGAAPIESTNIGFQLLRSLGWEKGQGLGARQQGITEPILVNKHGQGQFGDRLGIGSSHQIGEMIKATTSKHRQLKSEQIAFESWEDQQERKERASRDQQTKAVLHAQQFNCALCNKSYIKAVDFDAHLSSYDHNHRKRFQDMRQGLMKNRKPQLEDDEKEPTPVDDSIISTGTVGAWSAQSPTEASPTISATSTTKSFSMKMSSIKVKR